MLVILLYFSPPYLNLSVPFSSLFSLSVCQLEIFKHSHLPHASSASLLCSFSVGDLTSTEISTTTSTTHLCQHPYTLPLPSAMDELVMFWYKAETSTGAEDLSPFPSLLKHTSPDSSLFLCIINFFLPLLDHHHQLTDFP